MNAFIPPTPGQCIAIYNPNIIKKIDRSVDFLAPIMGFLVVYMICFLPFYGALNFLNNPLPHYLSWIVVPILCLVAFCFAMMLAMAIVLKGLEIKPDNGLLAYYISSIILSLIYILFVFIPGYFAIEILSKRDSPNAEIAIPLFALSLFCFWIGLKLSKLSETSKVEKIEKVKAQRGKYFLYYMSGGLSINEVLIPFKSSENDLRIESIKIQDKFLYINYTQKRISLWYGGPSASEIPFKIEPEFLPHKSELLKFLNIQIGES